jgi:hypothetical protein
MIGFPILFAVARALATFRSSAAALANDRSGRQLVDVGKPRECLFRHATGLAPALVRKAVVGRLRKYDTDRQTCRAHLVLPSSAIYGPFTGRPSERSDVG